MLLLIDNYDSFTYNLYQMLGALTQDITVVRNDATSVSAILETRPSHVVISPGPGRPTEAGICEELVLALAGKVPILGVCLGHQAICECFGGRIIGAPVLVHGKATDITIDPDCALFADVPKHILAARYHSLVADPHSLPDCLRVVAHTEEGTIMAVEHGRVPVAAPLYGVQFHPESILTPEGGHILKNFIAAGATTV
ncbi:MAG: aminodeoxychorismate/anthranilate synthase component II [Coriobacteriaceae bacterium]|nr:aminodeoxychorismate/anthranilate synthase component II [Coriobacteriaceae bacterium]